MPKLGQTTTRARIKSSWGGKATKRSKYNNQKVEYDGHVFDSKLECARYKELRQLEKAGEISELELQPKFDITVGVGENETRVGYYKADFRYYDIRSQQMIWEDVKGFRTAMYRFKKKCVEALYGIKITEVV